MLQIEELGGRRFVVRSRFGLVVRLLGLSFVILGGWIGVAPLAMNLADWVFGQITVSAFIECLPGMLIGGVIGIPMLCAGWAMASLTHVVVIDLVEKCVTEFNDLIVWKIQKTYPLEDVQSVLLTCTATRVSNTTNYYVKVLIKTNADCVTVVSEPARRELEVREIARKLADILDVRLEDTIFDN